MDQFILTNVTHTAKGITVEFDVHRGQGIYQAIATAPTLEEAIRAATGGALYEDRRPTETPAARMQRMIDAVAYQ